jgi:hypothetical protein
MQLAQRCWVRLQINRGLDEEILRVKNIKSMKDSGNLAGDGASPNATATEGDAMSRLICPSGLFADSNRGCLPDRPSGPGTGLAGDFCGVLVGGEDCSCVLVGGNLQANVGGESTPPPAA